VMGTDEFCRQYAGKAVLVSKGPITISPNVRILDFERDFSPPHLLLPVVCLTFSAIFLLATLLRLRYARLDET